ncbi:NADH-quinone oxidoreductase subunit J [Zavarzinia sp. CC-PAN008]|uniref:NADH-quinone oxidoreductase subunit J n=1 Tax=Zavarzinia sp. CC-PAN008 TaxID=3243332 RepID=UPI003F742319
MTLASLAFYLFASITIASAVMVISARNPVHSVLFLILAFFNSAGLFLLLGAEFIAMILVIVYVGAVAVLFLFVVMMLDINFVELRQGFLQYLPIGALIGLVLLVELAFVVGGWVIPFDAALAISAPADAGGLTNTQALGMVLYTQFALPFQISGLILLVAMIGAIVLTLRQRAGVRRQSIAAQVARSRETAIELKNIPPGQGI